MLRNLVLVSLLGMGCTTHAYEALRAVRGIKYPNSDAEGTLPVVTTAWTLPSRAPYTGFSELIPYALRSPHQQEAGSCLYMSLTGIAEFWLSRLNPDLSREPEGPLDLSERHLMNVAAQSESQLGVENWRTDSVYLMNNWGGLLRNTEYRFTKGWVLRRGGRYVRVNPHTPGSSYSTRYNWVDEMDSAHSTPVTLPRLEREILFADPEKDQWNVGIMPHDIVDTIKRALVERRAPVHVIYNHYGYWHAVNILGFDDQADSKNCSFVRGFFVYMAEKHRDLSDQADQASDPQRRAELLRAAEKARRTGLKAQEAFNRGGGCQSRGMFYVRDSIYSDANGPVYDYDPAQQGDEAPYARPIVLHEYDWIRYLGNHASVIFLQESSH
ncbi:MAG: hypothetical protein AB7G93_06200 [Bdellovibrionales bacterium]